MNIANMPMVIVNKLKERGYEAEQVHYNLGDGHPLGYPLDRSVNFKALGGRTKAQITILKEYLERDFDIFHFWNKSLFYKADVSLMSGLDIPLIKARGKKIIHRFTGFDLRTSSKDLAFNPYSPFRYGYVSKVPEEAILRYIDFLHEYVDQFLVQDPELQQFCSEAKIIPRALALNDYKFVGIKKNDVPLIVHAPTDKICKGSNFILKALEELKNEGLKFELKLIQGMSHQKAAQIYRNSDIIIDQILIGAPGVFTLEAMALGKPVIANLREDLFSCVYGNEMPVANANPVNIKQVIKKLVQDYEWRKHLSTFGRKIVEKHHDIDLVIDDFIDTYQSVMHKSSHLPKTYKDLDYLGWQTNQCEQTLSKLIRANQSIQKLNEEIKHFKTTDTFLTADKPFKKKRRFKSPLKILKNKLNFLKISH
ncbi:glycosyltransferase [Legionella beliardensis]|nr:glycosyltransferase [Legionella beliardensis]